MTRKAKASVRNYDTSTNVDKESDDDAVADLAEANTAQGDDQPNHDQVSGIEVVCRPRVGVRLAGGGFVGVWKKMKCS